MAMCDRRLHKSNGTTRRFSVEMHHFAAIGPVQSHENKGYKLLASAACSAFMAVSYAAQARLQSARNDCDLAAFDRNSAALPHIPRNAFAPSVVVWLFSLAAELVQDGLALLIVQCCS